MGGTPWQVASQDPPQHQRPAKPTLLWGSKTAPHPAPNLGDLCPQLPAAPTGTQTCTHPGHAAWFLPTGTGGWWVTAAGTRDTGRASSRWHQCSSTMPTGMPRQDANLVPVPQHDANHVAQPRQDANPAVPSGSNANHARVAGPSARGAGPGVPVGSEQRCPPKQTWGTISASFTNSPQPQNGEEKGKKSHLGPFALHSDLNIIAEHSKAITCSNYLPGDEGGNVTLNFKQEPEWGG